MPDKDEKERRKQILNDLKQKADKEFEEGLPMSRESFKNLFDHLDIELTEKGCNHTVIITETFLEQNKIENIETILSWIADKGGYCDCEILANVEQQFE
jgi:Protein of unknown function (DUF2695)